jgi:hypothetical protein
MRDDVMCSLCRAGHKPTRLKRQKIHHDRRTGRIVLCEDQPMSDGNKRGVLRTPNVKPNG